MTETEQRLDALEAELAELRRAVAVREAFLRMAEEEAYARGRESILGRNAEPRAPRTRHLQLIGGDAS